MLFSHWKGNQKKTKMYANDNNHITANDEVTVASINVSYLLYTEPQSKSQLCRYIFWRICPPNHIPFSHGEDSPAAASSLFVSPSFSVDG